MDWLQKISNNTELSNHLDSFLDHFGTDGLQHALKEYSDHQHFYICKTHTSLYKIPIKEIYYLEIQEHNITIFTPTAKYTKYGTLSRELTTLAPLGFAPCSQSVLVALNKIVSIEKGIVILDNGIHLHVSRSCKAGLLKRLSDF